MKRNKFIITLSFLVVFSFHILFIIYFRNSEIYTTNKINSNDEIVQIQLTKAYEPKEIIEEKKIVEEKIIKEVQPKKEPIKKTETPKKEIIKTISDQTTLEEVEKTITKTQQQTEKTVQIDTNEQIEKNKAEEKKYVDDYSKRLRDEINKNKNYPTISKKLKEEGEVIIAFRVEKNGTFKDIKISKSSFKKRLDEAGLNAVIDTKEFEPFDDKITHEYLDFTLPILFTLE